MPNTIVLDAPSQPHLTFVAPGEGAEYDILNQHTVCLLSQEQTGGAFSLFFCTVPPGVGPPLHQHGRENGTFYILSGRFEFQENGRPVAVRAGTCVHAPQNSRHTFKNVGSIPGTFLWIVTPGGFEGFFEDMNRLPPGPPDVAHILEIAARHRLVFARPPMDRRANAASRGGPPPEASPRHAGPDRRVHRPA